MGIFCRGIELFPYVYGFAKYPLLMYLRHCLPNPVITIAAERRAASLLIFERPAKPIVPGQQEFCSAALPRL